MWTGTWISGTWYHMNSSLFIVIYLLSTPVIGVVTIGNIIISWWYLNKWRSDVSCPRRPFQTTPDMFSDLPGAISNFTQIPSVSAIVFLDPTALWHLPSNFYFQNTLPSGSLISWPPRALPNLPRIVLLLVDRKVSSVHSWHGYISGSRCLRNKYYYRNIITYYTNIL